MLDELCRLCGNSNNEMFDIFCENGSNKKLEFKIKETVHLNILQDDPLPNTVCVLCIKQLENASNFIDQCHQTQTYLSQLYQDSKSALPILIESYRSLCEPSHTEKVTNELNDQVDTVNNAIQFRSIPIHNLESQKTNSDYHSVEKNSNQRIPEDQTDKNIFQNYTESPNVSSDVQDNLISLISNSKNDDNSSNKEERIQVENINNKHLTNSPSNDTCSSKNNSQQTILSINTQNTSTDRSRLKRKCTTQIKSINNHLDFSDEDNHIQSELSDDSNFDDEYYELCHKNAKKRPQKSQPPSTFNKKKSKKDPSKNFASEQSKSPGALKTNDKENDTNQQKTNHKRRFYCTTCRKTFSEKLTYEEHLNIHTGNRPFMCKLCTASFKARQHLNRHIRTVHSENKLKCPFCDHEVKHKGKLTQHIKAIHDKPFACDMCDYRTGEKGRIQQHIANKHVSASGELITNVKISKDVSVSASGALNANVKENFSCATCKKTFSQELTYQEHLNFHSGNRPFTCKLCTASFRARQDLNQHLRTIHSEKQLKCPSCDHIAKHKGKLTEHIKSVHNKPFACDMCDYRTGEKGKIQQHIANKHTSALSYVCEVCGNGFKTKCSLQVHIRNIHFPEPKVCQICGTVCPSLARYSAHIFRCGKERKKYTCDKCGRTYVNKEILRDHMNKHLNIKPYKCNVCAKAFFQRNRLDTHKYVHRGANYQCEICNHSFNRKDNMKNHMKRHFYKSMRCDDTIVTAV